MEKGGRRISVNHCDYMIKQANSMNWQHQSERWRDRRWRGREMERGRKKKRTDRMREREK